MTAGALPRRGGRAAPRSRGGHRGARRGTAFQAAAFGRLAACLSCVLLAATAVRENYLFRGFEATLASHVVALATSMPAGPIPQTPTFWFTVAPHHEMGLQITPACTVVLMMTPFLIATAFLVWRRSSSIVRPLVACVIAVAMLLVVNQLRILAIIMFVLHLGFNGGFYWGHTMVGSLITIVGGSATLVMYVFVAVKRGTPGRARQSAH
jgi:exosortase/archaeosortase family protein